MSNKKCFEYEAINLKTHQKLPTIYLSKSSNTGIIAFFGTGTGKSITALTTIRCLGLPSILILPPAVVGGFHREITRLDEFKSISIDIYSYGQFINAYNNKGNSLVRGKLLIIDEVHNFRSSGLLTLKLIMAFSNAKKRLLLTGTPLQNEPLDILPALCMTDAPPLKDIDHTKEYYKTRFMEFTHALNEFESRGKRELLNNLLYNKTIYYAVNLETHPKFPSVKVKYINIEMTPAYQKEYEIIEHQKKQQLPADLKEINLAVFYNGLRRATNKVRVESPKISEVMKILKKHLEQDHRIVVYSTWQNSGIRIIKDRLLAMNVACSVVSGEETQAAKARAVVNYNTGKTPVMLITKAGAAGLDLKKTRAVIIIEPHWNNELIKQVIGRAARYESHIDLPESQQNVIVYRFILRRNGEKSIDEVIDDMAKEKDARNDKFYSLLKKNRFRAE